MTPKALLLLSEFCYKTTDVNEVTTKRSNRDAVTELTIRKNNGQEETSGFRSQFDFSLSL